MPGFTGAGLKPKPGKEGATTWKAGTEFLVDLLAMILYG
jgi:hypothetical protein